MALPVAKGNVLHSADRGRFAELSGVLGEERCRPAVLYELRRLARGPMRRLRNDHPSGRAFLRCLRRAPQEDVGTFDPRLRRGAQGLSVLFADLAGFTAHSDGADPEDMKARLDPYFTRAREVIDSLGGMVEKFIGDAVVGLFGAPTSREDDATRAVQAAWEIARAIDELNARGCALELSIRIAVDTGEAVVDLDADVERGEAYATGDVLNTASRLQQEAPIGRRRRRRAHVPRIREVVRLGALEPVTVKGKPAPIPIWLVLGPRPEHDRAPLAPLIGRRESWSSSGRSGTRSAPIGGCTSSRSSVRRGSARAAWCGSCSRVSIARAFLKGRCRPYGETTGFGAFGQQVFQIAEVFENDPTTVARAKLRIA